MSSPNTYNHLQEYNSLCRTDRRKYLIQARVLLCPVVTIRKGMILYDWTWDSGHYPVNHDSRANCGVGLLYRIGTPPVPSRAFAATLDRLLQDRTVPRIEVGLVSFTGPRACAPIQLERRL